MENKQNPRIYRLVPSEQLERLIKTNFLLSKSLLLFEYLCSQSDEPLFLTADAACEVLDIRPETLTRYRQKRLIRPKIYRRQFLYSAYDLLMLVYRINQRNLQMRCGVLPGLWSDRMSKEFDSGVEGYSASADLGPR